RLGFNDAPQAGAVSAGEVLSRVVAGTDVMAWTTPVATGGTEQVFQVFSGAVPFGLQPIDHVRWLRADGARLMEEAYARQGYRLRAIPCGVAGGPGGWFRREVRSPRDFRGLKVRAPRLMAKALAGLGAQIVNEAQTSKVPAMMAARSLDASLWYAASEELFLKAPRAATVYHFPGVHAPTLTFVLLVGEQTWLAMSGVQRQLFDEACRRHISASAVKANSRQNDILNRIRSQRIIVRPFTLPVRESLQQKVSEILSAESAGNEQFRETLGSYNRFRK
ncbi:MAG: hypothetical protein ACK5JT_13010, partial [Hyphomicrobiaceae bacterium]